METYVAWFILDYSSHMLYFLVPQIFKCVELEEHLFRFIIFSVIHHLPAITVNLTSIYHFFWIISIKSLWHISKYIASPYLIRRIIDTTNLFCKYFLWKILYLIVESYVLLILFQIISLLYCKNVFVIMR